MFVDLLVYAGLIPTALAAMVALAFFWLAPETLTERYALPVSMAIAFFISYAVAFENEHFQPSRYWHWLPHLVGAAAVLTGLSLATGVGQRERAVLYLLFALASAGLLLPSGSLSPRRPYYLAIVAGYLWLLATMLLALASHQRTLHARRWFLGMCAFAASVCALLITYQLSLQFGQMAGMAAAALIGCSVVASLGRRKVAVTGIALPYTLSVAGATHCAHVYPIQPLFGLLLIPASPLALWVMEIPGLNKLKGWKAVVIRVVLVAVPAAGGAWLAFGRELFERVE